MFNLKATPEQILNELTIASQEGPGYYLAFAGPNYEIYTPEFQTQMKIAQTTIEQIQQAIEDQGAEV